MSETESASSDAFRARDSEDRLWTSYQRKDRSLNVTHDNNAKSKSVYMREIVPIALQRDH